MNKTKIVATLGPNSSNKEIMREMFNAGLSACRINFSHGSYDEHTAAISTIRELNQELNANVAILADLQGPKIRTGLMENDSINLEMGSTCQIITKPVTGNSQCFSINYLDLPKDVNPGERILLDDGKLVLQVEKTDYQSCIHCTVIQGGVLSSKKGVNFPNTKISMPSLTEKDKADLTFALEHRVDWVCLSFVRSAQDIRKLKELIASQGGKAKVIAKIEKPEALNCIEEIISATDGVMVARGDLGVETPYQRVPVIQKMLIDQCVAKAKPVIVATQMMESMIHSMTPSRAEVNDVANAVLDGADAVMLSGETSVGKYPVEVIQTISNIVEEIEKSPEVFHREVMPDPVNERFITDSICFNACRLAHRVQAKAIITMSFSGYTAFKVSSQRPDSAIFVFTSNRLILSQLNLLWGVKAFFYDKHVSTDHTIADIKHFLSSNEYVKTGDLIINIASMPIEDYGGSNMLKLSRVN